jgi:hypothetical protein
VGARSSWIGAQQASVFHFTILLELEPHDDHQKHGIYKPSFAEEI